MARISKWISIIERCGLLYRNAEFAEMGLSGSNHMYIFYLCKNPGVSQDELSKLLHINKSNVTRSISYLEKADFIKREVNQNDKRHYCLFATKKAYDVLPNIIDKMTSWNVSLMSGLTEEEQELLTVMLKKIAINACEYANRHFDVNGE